MRSTQENKRGGVRIKKGKSPRLKQNFKTAEDIASERGQNNS